MNRSACTLLLVSTLTLGGCASMSDFAIDPSEWFSGDWFGNKKKLPGERRPVFPEGVPGVSRGVPTELVKGNQQQPGAGQDVPLVQAITEEPKPKAKPKPKPQVAAKPAKPAEPESRPTPITVRRSDAPAGQQQPAAGQQQPAADQQWPDPTPPRQQRPASTAWPDPPRPGGGSGGIQWPDPPPTR